MVVAVHVQASSPGRAVLPLEAGLTVLEFHGSELSPQDLHEEVPAAARGLQEAGVNPLRLVLNHVEHRLDLPGWGKHLPVVRDALLGLEQAHRQVSGYAAPWRVS